MAKFSPTEAVFAGFRFVRERPVTLLIWSAYLLVMVAVASLAMFDLGGDQMTALVAASQGGAFDPVQISKISQDLLPASSFAALLMVVFGAVLSTAILRVFTEPGAHPWGGLRFGGDELRLLGAGLLVILVSFFAEILVGLAAGLAASAGLPTIPVLIVGFLLILALQVRLSLAPIVSLTEKRVSLARAWALTAKGFWSLLGAYVLLLAITLVILVLVGIVFGALMAATAMATGGGSNPLALVLAHNYDAVNPLMLVLYVLMNLAQVWLAMVVLAVSLCVGVQAYRAFAADLPKV
jgi:hypothetical protein